MKILAIDTAAEACSAALWLDGEVRLRYKVQPRGHSELILGMMEEVLAEAGMRLTELDALAFGRGPGAFTGLRIATGVAQGAAFGAGLSVIPVSTLAAVARRAWRENGWRELLVAFDARMNEVYWGTFRIDVQGMPQPVAEEVVSPPTTVELPEGAAWYGVGPGWDAYAEQLAPRLGPRLLGTDPGLLVSAEDIAALAAVEWTAGRLTHPRDALPVYLRNQVVQRPCPPPVAAEIATKERP